MSPFLLLSPNILYTEGTSSQIPQQEGAVQVAATSLYEPLKHLSSNIHISLDHLHKSFCIFQVFPGTLPAKKNEATQFYYNYQMQHVSQTAKIFKCISECKFRRTRLTAMHNTVMTRNTNDVPPSGIPSSSADSLPVQQFKY
jgi:hypothetical protein